MSWTAVFRSNPSDPRPLTFWWDPKRGLRSPDDSMLGAAQRLAASLDTVSATPTGPFAIPDLSVGHLAFAVVWELGIRAGLAPEEIDVTGDDWRWPPAPPLPTAPAEDALQLVY